jgi:hydroxyethylthiazole kinase-like uncharacterized protein yjeF
MANSFTKQVVWRNHREPRNLKRRSSGNTMHVTMSDSMQITLDYAKGLLPPRPGGAHKGTFGHLYVLAGSRGFTGAARLCVESAYRSGTGLVTLGIPEPLGDIVASVLVEAMSHVLPSTSEETLAASAVEPAISAAAVRDAVVIGPGLSQHHETARFVQAFLMRCSKPCIVDADGLNALRGNIDALHALAAPRIITPHPGEMARLLELDIASIQAKREGIARSFAKQCNSVVVLKGANTVVADSGGDVFVNTTGNSGLATGGTGDVLSGVIGGLLAQGMPPRDAAALGVYVHGLAGDLASKVYTRRGMIARDVIAHLPDAWKILGEV